MIWPERRTDQHEAQGGTRFFADEVSVPVRLESSNPSGISSSLNTNKA